MKLVIDLFAAFAKIGSFTFGGGYAMLPMIKKEIVEKHGWVTDQEILDYFAISQVTPGVIAVNTATFVGYKIGGLVGAIAATLGVIPIDSNYSNNSSLFDKFCQPTSSSSRL